MSRLSPEMEAQKRAIYERLAPRRRKWVDKVGYEAWDPFQLPNDPIDIRKDENQLTAKELMRLFLRTVPEDRMNDLYTKGANELCLGLIARDEQSAGQYDFAVWYERFSRERAEEGDA